MLQTVAASDAGGRRFLIAGGSSSADPVVYLWEKVIISYSEINCRCNLSVRFENLKNLRKARRPYPIRKIVPHPPILVPCLMKAGRPRSMASSPCSSSYCPTLTGLNIFARFAFVYMLRAFLTLSSASRHLEYCTSICRQPACKF